MDPPGERLALVWLSAVGALLAGPAVALLVHPVLAVFTAVILALAILRTATIAMRARLDRRGLRSDRLFVRFLGSLGVASAIVLGPIVAFVIASVPVVAGFGSGCGGGDEVARGVAVFACLVVAFGAGYLLKRWLWTPRDPGSSRGAAELARSRGRAPRFSLARAMKMIAVLSVGFAILQALVRRPDGRYIYDTQNNMYDFCIAEATLFDARSRDCRSRAADGVPWDDPAEYSRLLRTGPYPWDRSINRTWSEQSQVWKRAADQARKMARWYGSH